MASPVVSRHTTGSNHIWKTSSGKSDLKSHFTVSQRLGVRNEEGMDRREMAGLFTLRWSISFFLFSLPAARELRRKNRVGQHRNFPDTTPAGIWLRKPLGAGANCYDTVTRRGISNTRRGAICTITHVLARGPST